MSNQILKVGKSFQLVFKNRNYVILASTLIIVITLIILLINVLVLNYSLLVYVFTSGDFDFEAKKRISLAVLTAIRTDLPFSSIAAITGSSILLAIDISFLTFYFKRQMVVKAGAGVGIFGILIGFLGIGCSACGSIILSSVLGFTAATSLIGFLPFAGLEFGIIGILLLLFAIYLIAIKIQKLNNCKIP